MAIVQTSSVQQVLQALPERAQIVAGGGQSYGCTLKAANHFTPVAALPTTLANLALQNNELGGGKSYIIDTVWVVADTSVAAANNVTILVQPIKAGTTLVADSANKTVYSLSCKSAYAGKAQIAVASSSVGALADQWIAVGPGNTAPSASIGEGYEANVYGRFIIPPQCTFAVNAIFGTAAGTAIMGITWHEVVLALN